MKIEKALFIGGDPNKFPSVQIRCEDIASRLGCDRIFSVKKAEEVPAAYSVFICVKPCLRQEEILKLAQRGAVVWDIIDSIPPKHGISTYLASTQKVKGIFDRFGRVEVIPHHHCNFDGVSNPPECRRPGWIGTLHWYPQLNGFEHDIYNASGMSAADVAKAYRQIGIGLNLRAERPKSNFHVEVNTGIKLINCIGFGIPSISSDEPAYREVGEHCTIFSDINQCAHWIHELQNDGRIYQTLRENCQAESSKYHITSILNKYTTLIASL